MIYEVVTYIVMAYIVMAYTVAVCTVMTTATTSAEYDHAISVMEDMATACIGMACLVMTHLVMTYLVTACRLQLPQRTVSVLASRVRTSLREYPPTSIKNIYAAGQYLR